MMAKSTAAATANAVKENKPHKPNDESEKKTHTFLIIKGHAHFFNKIITTIQARNDDEYNLKGDVKS